MILSASKARRLCANYQILTVVPELQAMVEANRRKENEVNAKKKSGCNKGCDDATVFADVEADALNAIAALSPDAMARLAAFTKDTSIFAYISKAGGKPAYTQLFPPVTK